MKGIPSFSIKRPVATTMMIVAFLFAGLLGMFSMKTEMMPSFNIPVVVVSTVWVGASPEDVDKLITKKIEDAVYQVEGVDKVQSTSAQDVSTVVVEFKFGVDVNDKMQDIQKEIDIIKTDLPEDAEDSIVDNFDPAAEPILYYYLYGNNKKELKDIAEDQIKVRLEKIKGVGEVQIAGGIEEEILVELDPNKLEGYGLRVMDVMGILKSSSKNLPLGTLRDGGKEYVVRMLGEIDELEQVANIIVSNNGGNIIRLSDVADVRLDVKDITSYARQNGKDALRIAVVKTSDGNAVDVAEDAKKIVDELKVTFPNDVKIFLVFDQSEAILDSIGTVKENGFTGLILATIVLLIFLKNVRATSVITFAIPISIVATFSLLASKGITLNVISLMGLSLGVGMLVDNSVIVLDNIFRHLTELKEDRETAAANGAAEMVIPMLTSTATSVAVFLPIVLKQGMAREIFHDLSYTITFSLLSSLVVAISFVPMAASSFMSSKVNITAEGKIISFIKDNYVKLLRVALKFKVTTVIVAVGFAAMMILFSKNIDSEFLPMGDQGLYAIDVTVPKGIDVDKADKIAKEIEKIVKADSYTKDYRTVVEADSIRIEVEVESKLKRKPKETIVEIVDKIRPKFSNIQDAKLNVAAVSTYGGGGAPGESGDIVLNIVSDNTDMLNRLSEIYLEKMQNMEGLVDINSSFQGGNPQLQINLDRVKAQKYGVRVSDIIPLVATQLKGEDAFTIQLDNKEVDVTIRYGEAYRNSPSKLLKVKIDTMNGPIELGEIAKLNIVEGPAEVKKLDKRKKLTLTANVAGGVKLVDALKVLKEDLNKNLPDGADYTFGGDQESMKDVMADLSLGMAIGIFLIYFILAAQFESFVLPFIIMGTVPLSISGVLIGLGVTGFPFNIMVMIGIIMLAGIVVNNAIVLIDYIKLLREKDYSLYDAIIEAGRTRLRPILMTTLTTVGGMIPLAVAQGEGSELYKGMAIAVVFGLSFSTLLTLIVIPCLYYIIERIKEIMASRKIKKSDIFKNN